MFTGIVEDIGFVAVISKLAGRWEFSIRTSIDPSGIAVGESVSVDGVCLTVIRMEGDAFVADASLETLRVTTLKEKGPGDPVNLERAMKADSRFGGHMVMGHVDGLGRILRVTPEGDSLRFEIEVPRDIAGYIVKKGSVAIDGISLTVNEQSDNRFVLNVIPYSSLRTTIGSKNAGDQVNVEVDIIGRYVERFTGTKEKSGTDLDFLYTYGYIKGR